MSAAAAAPVFQFGAPAPAPENAWGPALGQPPQQPQQWGGASVPGPPPGQPPNRHQWEQQAQPQQQQQQQQQQQWPPQVRALTRELPLHVIAGSSLTYCLRLQQQQGGVGVAPAQLDFATKMKLKNLQEQYGWVDKEQVAHAYITTGAHMGKTEQWLSQNFPKPADWVSAPPAAGAPGGPALPGMGIAPIRAAPTLHTAKPVGDYFAIGLQVRLNPLIYSLIYPEV